MAQYSCNMNLIISFSFTYDFFIRFVWNIYVKVSFEEKQMNPNESFSNVQLNTNVKTVIEKTSNGFLPLYVFHEYSRYKKSEESYIAKTYF